MQIIYCHHAERDSDYSKPLKLREQEDITKLGEIDADIFGQMKSVSKRKITKIYSSPYIRYRHTAEIINKYFNVEIVDESRFNEFDSDHESWIACQTRTIEAINDIIKKSSNDDVILCVTSGVNLGAFMCWAYDIEPSEKTPFLGVMSCSPIIFEYDKEK